MELSDCNYTFDEIKNMLNYYVATPHIYDYCYKNSPEFKSFIDSRSKEDLDSFKQLRTMYKEIHRPRDYFLLHGELYLTKKKRDKREVEALPEKIESEEFKFFFSHFDEIMKQRAEKRKHGKHRMNGKKKW